MNGSRRGGHGPVGEWFVLAAVTVVGSLLAGCDSNSGKSAGTPAQTAPSGPSILLISIDTLRADHLGCYGYFRDTSPNIDAFAAQSVFFENAYAPMAVTLPSHTSMLTAVHPLEHGSLANVLHNGKPFTSRPALRSFAEMAKSAGYSTGAFVSAAPLRSRESGLSVGFDVYDDQFDGKERRCPQTTERAAAWLTENAGKPFFLFVHYFDPHTPYTPAPPFSTMFQTDDQLEAYLAARSIPERIEGNQPCRGKQDTITRVATNLYDGEIRFCDSQVAILLEQVRSLGLWDETVIILTGDHGEGLNQHDWPQHGRTWKEQLHVPLVIHFPDAAEQLPSRFEPVVSLVDLMPTVAARYGWKWAEQLTRQASGVDVLAPGFGERPGFAQRSDRECEGEGGPLFVLSTRDWRYHYRSESEAWLFNLADDPHELTNVAAGSPDVATEMRKTLLGLRDQFTQRGVALGAESIRSIEASSEHLKQMEALGYVGGADEDGGEEPDEDPDNP